MADTTGNKKEHKWQLLHGCSVRPVAFRQLFPEQRVSRVLLMQELKLLSRRGFVLVSQVIEGQNDAGKRRQEPAAIRGQLQLFEPLFLVAFDAANTEYPADRRGFLPDDVFSQSVADIGAIV